MDVSRNIKSLKISALQAVSNQRFIKRSEEEVWQDFVNGSESALVYIYREYSNKLFNYGMQFVKDREFVLDVMQDLFYYLIKTHKRLGKTTSIKFYLLSSMRRMLLRRLKEEKRINTESLEQKSFDVAFQGVDPGSLEEYEVQVLKNACNSLPPRQKEAILLLFYEELSYSEIAEVMCIKKIKYARTLIYRSIETLRSIITGSKSSR